MGGKHGLQSQSPGPDQGSLGTEVPNKTRWVPRASGSLWEGPAGIDACPSLEAPGAQVGPGCPQSRGLPPDGQYTRTPKCAMHRRRPSARTCDSQNTGLGGVPVLTPRGCAASHSTRGSEDGVKVKGSWLRGTREMVSREGPGQPRWARLDVGPEPRNRWASAVV